MSDQIETSRCTSGPQLPAAGPERIPAVSWGPETVERRDLFEAWHEAARPFFDTSPGGDAWAFSGGGMLAKMGDLVLSEVSFTAQRFDRTRRHLADNDSYSVQLYTRGSCVGTIGDMPYRLAPGRIAMFDFGCELRTLAPEPSVVLGASVPRSLLDTSRSRLEILREDMDKLTPTEAAEAAAGFIVREH